MALPMTIHEARAMQADDVALDDDAVQQAEDEATEAEQAAATLTESAINGGKGSAAPSAVTEARAVAEFARQRAGRMRDRADRAKAARRLLALEKVGQDVEKIAADASKPGESIAAAVQKIADGHAELMRLAAEHDAKVDAAITRAKELGAEPPAPSGPRASSAHVTIVSGGSLSGPAGVQSGSSVVRKIGAKTAAEAAQLAAAGDADGALNRLQAARYVKPPERAAFYFLGANGMVHGVDNPAVFADQIRKKQMRELSPDEIDAYLDGRFDGHPAQA